VVKTNKAKMKTKIQRLFLALATIGLVQSAGAQFNYVTNNGAITITHYTGSDSAVIIPDTINDFAVVSIGPGAFYFSSITSVIIPNSVTNIGDSAFQSCGSLNAITIPNSVIAIGNYEFQFCGSLTNLSIPSSVISVGDFAFFACTNLATITVDAANSMYSSVDGVLFDKSQTTLIQFPNGKGGDYTISNGVTCIGVAAFEDCLSLTNVTIPPSVTNVGTVSFSICPNLTAITVDPANSFYSSTNGILFDKSQTTLIQFPNGKSGSYTISESVASIGNYAFYYCTGLTNIIVPNSITNIGRQVFAECKTLTSVTIPNTVTSIGDVAFDGCANLINITIPNSVASIGSYAFAFTGLTNIEIPTSVTNIGTQAFRECKSLTGIAIPNTVSIIEDSTFEHCTSLTNVTIPNSITNIGNRAFYNCTSLTALYFQGNAPVVGSNAFVFDSKLTIYYLPETTGWNSIVAGRPAVLWNPQATTYSVAGGQFSFIISGPINVSIVVEACTNLVQPIWLPVSTNTLTGGSSSFSDSQSSNYSARFYRLRSQ
jgi:hypothetical protein